MPKKALLFSITALSALALLGAGCTKKQSTSAALAITPVISISDQSLGADNQMVINNASIPDDGWITIHAKENGLPGKVLGYTSLLKGEGKKIKVTIDRTDLSPSLIAILHYDRGEKGVFEFPDNDGPVIKDQQVIMQEFNILNFAEVTKDSPSAPAGVRREFIITAKQWSFSPSVIKVKKGDTVVLKLSSADVAHSLTIQEFGINVAIKPGETKIIEFVADKTGTFEFICKIPCGVGHMGMKGTLIVE
jgi:plastocyanin